MSNTDRIRAYYNLHRKCFSIQDYQTGLVIEHTDKLFVTNAMFVVRESGNKKVKREGRKNVHAFVNGIRQSKLPLSYQGYLWVKYDPYTMDFFHYRRIVNGKPEYLEVDRHWIGNVYLSMVDGHPCIYADIDKLSDTKNVKPSDTKCYKFDKIDRKVLQELADFKKELFPNNIKNKDFLIRKQRQINNKKKLLAI